MTKTHGLIAAASLVGLVIGFTLGQQRDSQPGKSAISSKESPTRQTRSSQHSSSGVKESSNNELLSSLLKGRSIQELSSAELSKIFIQLSTYDANQDPVARAKQNYQLQLLLKKTSPARLKEVAESILGNPDSKPSMNLSSILSALTARDPQGAMAWAKSQPNPERLVAMILSNTAKDDPTGAAEKLREGLMNGTFSSNDSYTSTYSIAAAMAKLGKNNLLEFIDSLPSQLQNYTFQSAIREVPEHEQSALLDELYQRSKDGKMQSYDFTNLFSSYTIPADKAEAWLAKMEPGKERLDLELSYARNLLGNGKSEIAQEWFKRSLAQNSGKEKEILLKAMNNSNLRSSDINMLTSFLPPGIELNAEDFKNQGNSYSYSGFSSLLNRAQAINNPVEKAKLMTHAFTEFAKNIQDSSNSNRLNDNDFAIVQSQIPALNLSPEDAATVQAALAAAQAAQPKPKKKKATE